MRTGDLMTTEFGLCLLSHQDLTGVFGILLLINSVKGGQMWDAIISDGWLCLWLCLWLLSSLLWLCLWLLSSLLKQSFMRVTCHVGIPAFSTKDQPDTPPDCFSPVSETPETVSSLVFHFWLPQSYAKELTHLGPDA